MKKTKDREKPHFYCSKCGKEVPFNAEICPSCRTSFTKVMCPECHYSNEAKFFSRGCPVCGHMAPALSLKQKQQKAKLAVNKRDIVFLITLPILVILFVLLALLYLRS
ncbi:double zinc ribbon domain-containing protein [Spirochaeta cellobiosiphila]|uniref:double zinc ribbon domain-containing protein n=1 Tax=Spirochaeta cellobiosiphila TaxID=504483 RepID=UPI000567F49F|nr:zinc ribbon domain-containing protein [Spirochaeta cellobiosiphila]